MPTSLATATAIMKEVYEAPLRYQLNDEVVALKRIVRSSAGVTEEVGGKYVTFPIHVARNSGIGSRRELDDLPVAGNQGTAAARVGLKYHYGAIGMSGQSIKLVDTNYQAFISNAELETTRLKTDLAKDQNRQVYGDGTGAIATTSTVGATGTVTITKGAMYLQEGEILDVYTPANLAADGANKGTVTITAITASNPDGTGTITVTPATVAFAANDVFVRTANANKEWTGLGAIVNDSGILYNVNPATYSVWKSTVDQNGGTPRPLSENDMTKMVDNVRTKGGKISLILTSLGVRRSYANLLMQQRQFVNTDQKFEGGFSGLAFTTDSGEIPVVSDVDHPKNTMYFLDEKHLNVYKFNDWEWLSYKDSDIWRPHPTKDSFNAFMYQYSELGTDQRNAHGVIRDLIEN